MMLGGGTNASKACVVTFQVATANQCFNTKDSGQFDIFFQSKVTTQTMIIHIEAAMQFILNEATT